MRIWKAVAVAACLTPTAASPQNPGDTVRVSGTLVTEYLGVQLDGLQLGTGLMPYAEITSFEIKTETKRKTVPGIVLGALAGVVGTIVVVNYACRDDQFGYCGLAAFLLAPVVGIGGGVIGGLIGHSLRTYEFTPVAVPRSDSGWEAVPIVGVGPIPPIGLAVGSGRVGLQLGGKLRF